MAEKKDEKKELQDETGFIHTEELRDLLKEKENVPWVELKAVNCDKILSIDFISDSTNKCCGGLIDIFGRSLELINEELTRHELNNIDFLHSIKLEKVSLLDITKIQELFEEGYKQTKEKMWKIKEYLEK